MITAFDTETFRFRSGLMAPPLVCLSEHGERGTRLLHARDAILRVRSTEGKHVWHNGPGFDLPVLVEAGLPIEEVFAWLDEERVSDTLVREKLLDVAEGTKFYRTADGKTAKRKYDLSDLSIKYLGSALEKGEDTYRTRYGELYHVPLEDWPAEARDYALKDAQTTSAVWWGQEERRERLSLRLGGDPLADEPRQVRRLWALSLMRLWGIRTDPEAIELLEERATKSFRALLEHLTKTGTETGPDELRRIVRSDGSRDTKAAKARMISVSRENGTTLAITDTGEKKIKAGELTEEGAVAAGYVSLDADACKRSGDLALVYYSKITSFRTVLSKDVKALRRGVHYPIHTRINSILDTGRPSSSDPNIFNIRGASSDPDDEFPIEGIRECFIPRPGKWFLQVDVSGLELATLAQVLLKIVGWSTMAEAILRYGEAGMLHTLFAARILGISPEEAVRREALGKKGDPEFYLARQTAKVANFGFPGGLGIKSLIFFARAKYRVELTEERARELKKMWLEQWPEMKEYFRIIGELCELGGGRATIRQLFSDRYRGRCTYTQACNGFFQSLGADATGHAFYEIQRACYVKKVGSPLFGSRSVNFVYDEWILEVDADIPTANARAKALVEIAEREANYFLPDVPIKMGAPVLMFRWSKDAKTTYNKQGELIPWAA